MCRLDGSLGTLEAGKLADVLVVQGDPLQDLAALTRVLLVIHAGTITRSENLSRRSTWGDCPVLCTGSWASRLARPQRAIHGTTSPAPLRLADRVLNRITSQIDERAGQRLPRRRAGV